MIKIENVEVVGLEHAIRGMRNPKNSWDRSDSVTIEEFTECPENECVLGDLDRCSDCHLTSEAGVIVGKNDHKLMMDLAAGGPVHAKYRRMIVVYLDITAPRYWWAEMDTYKVGTVANSCSTMHTIHKKAFTLEDFSTEKLTIASLTILDQLIDHLNKARICYRDFKEKEDWWQMIQLLPSSYNQKRTVMLNYEVLVGIYKWRKDHKLDEWREFCKWIESLPYSELITGGTLQRGLRAETSVIDEAAFTGNESEAEKHCGDCACFTTRPDKKRGSCSTRPEGCNSALYASTKACGRFVDEESK